MRNVQVVWEFEAQQVRNSLPVDHIVLLLGLTEVSLNPTVTNYTFVDVAPGTWAIRLTLIDISGNEMVDKNGVKIMLVGEAVVPVDPTVNVPVRLSVIVA